MSRHCSVWMSIDTECSLWSTQITTVELVQAYTRRSNRPIHRGLRTVILVQHQRCGEVERIHRLRLRCLPQSADCRASGLHRYQGVPPMRVVHHRLQRVLPFLFLYREALSLRCGERGKEASVSETHWTAAAATKEDLLSSRTLDGILRLGVLVRQARGGSSSGG